MPGGLALVQSAGHGERSEVCFDHRTKVSFARRSKVSFDHRTKVLFARRTKFRSTLVDPREGAAEFSRAARVPHGPRNPSRGQSAGHGERTKVCFVDPKTPKFGGARPPYLLDPALLGFSGGSSNPDLDPRSGPAALASPDSGKQRTQQVENWTKNS
jgi:hypothetical protein